MLSAFHLWMLCCFSPHRERDHTKPWERIPRVCLGPQIKQRRWDGKEIPQFSPPVSKRSSHTITSRREDRNFHIISRPRERFDVRAHTPIAASSSGSSSRRVIVQFRSANRRCTVTAGVKVFFLGAKTAFSVLFGRLFCSSKFDKIRHKPLAKRNLCHMVILMHRKARMPNFHS